jgi:hypothetical protein
VDTFKVLDMLNKVMVKFHVVRDKFNKLLKSLDVKFRRW